LAGREPKTILWYEAGHDLEPQAFNDAALWLQEYLGEDLLWMAPNYRESAQWWDWGYSGWLVACLGTCFSFLLISVQKRRGVNLMWLMAALLFGPISIPLYFFAIESKEQQVRNKAFKLWQSSLYLAILGAMLYLCGSIAGNLLSTLVFDGDLIILTYVLALVSGWVGLRLTAQHKRIGALVWLLSVNILWALNVLLSTPLLEFWGIPYFFHPKLLWYVASLSLINIVFLLVINRLLMEWGWIDAHRAGSQGIQPCKQDRLKCFTALVLTYVIDLAAILWLISNLTDIPFIDVLTEL
jgi:hypothetical protein